MLGPSPTSAAPPAPAGRDVWRVDLVAILPDLHAFARSLTRNPSEADDLVQETVAKAWARHHQFQPGTNLRAWLFTILRNTHYTALRRRQREVEDADGAYAANLSVMPAQEWKVAAQSIRLALRQLPEDQRAALIMIGTAGLTYEEAAEAAGCPLGTIKSRVNRGRARLLAILCVGDARDVVLERQPA